MDKETEAQRQEKMFDNISSKLGEQFSDYLVIVRLSGGSVATRASDRNWSYGAVSRFRNEIDNSDFVREDTQDADG